MLTQINILQLNVYETWNIEGTCVFFSCDGEGGHLQATYGGSRMNCNG